MALGEGCTCGPYMSITPPGPCPMHAPYRGVPYGWVYSTTSSVTRVCAGRHCAHDEKCNRYTLWNGQ